MPPTAGKITPNEPCVLGGETDAGPYTFPEGDYWLVVTEVGTTEEGLPFEEGEYSYRVLVTDEDGNESVEERTCAFKPLSFHVTAHDSMEESNPATDKDGNSTGISASVDNATEGTMKVYAENGVPVRLTRWTGGVTNDNTTPDGVGVITIGKKNYIKDAAGKYVECSDEGRFVEVPRYNPETPSQVTAELTLNRIEKPSAVSVTVNAEGASPDFPATAQIVSMIEKQVERAVEVPAKNEDGTPKLDADGNPVMTTETITETVYEEGDVVEGFESIAVKANEPVQVAELPRGHYGLKFLAAPQMDAEYGGGRGFTLPEGTQHFYVVGLGDAIELASYTLDHIWDKAAVNMTVSAYGAETEASFIVRDTAGNPIDPATGEAVVAAEGETIDESAYYVKVAPGTKTQLMALPRGSYTVYMVEAPSMSFRYTVKEPEIVDGAPTGGDIDVEKVGTWPFIAPTEPIEIEADGHGAAFDLAMECKLGDISAVVAGQTTIRADIHAEGARADDVLTYALVKVTTTGEGEDAVVDETEVVQTATVGLNRPAFLQSLAAGTYRLRVTKYPTLADGSTFTLDGGYYEFEVPEGAEGMDVSFTLTPVAAAAGEPSVLSAMVEECFAEAAWVAETSASAMAAQARATVTSEPVPLENRSFDRSAQMTADMFDDIADADGATVSGDGVYFVESDQQAIEQFAASLGAPDAAAAPTSETADEGEPATPGVTDELVAFAASTEPGEAPSESAVDTSLGSEESRKELTSRIKQQVKVSLLGATTGVAGNYSQDPQISFSSPIDISDQIGRAHV